MKAEKSISVILTLFVMHTLVLPAAAGPSSEVRAALKYAGGNQSELETALREVKGKDTEYLISHASQYDLVNLTAQQIIENVTYARRVHEALPYLGGKVEYELWRDWVLPHRVLEEDLSLWRRDFYERMQPVIADRKTVWEVVVAMHAWLMIGQNGSSPRVVFGPSETRCKTPFQMLEIGSGSCGELSMMMVYLMRAVGIPARHCLMCWRFAGPQLHFYCEYWDPQIGRWVSLDAGDDKPLKLPLTAQERSRTLQLGVLTFYAHPGFPSTRDSYRTACFTECVPVTANMFDVKDIGLKVLDGFAGKASAYVWNSGAWRTVAQGAGVNKSGEGIQFSKALDSVNRPVLYSVMGGTTLLWGMQRPSAKSGLVDLKQATVDDCLQWGSYDVP